MESLNLKLKLLLENIKEHYPNNEKEIFMAQSYWYYSIISSGYRRNFWLYRISTIG